MKSDPIHNKRRILWIIPGLLILGIICFALANKIVNSIDYHNNDFFTFWLAGHMVVHGGQPYSPAQWISGHQQFNVTWIPNQAFVYPLPLSLLYAPLALLSLYQAYITWVALSELMVLAALTLLIIIFSEKGRSKYIFIPILVGTIFFRPTILTLFNGQITALFLLLLTIVVIFWNKGKWEWGSLVLVFLMLKPNLGAPLVFLLGLWLVSQRRVKSILVMLLMGSVLVGIGFLQDPHWVSAYWSIGNTKVAETFGGSPTVWGLGYLLCRSASPCMPIVGGSAALLILLAFGWLVLRRNSIRTPFSVVSLAICVTLLITPYTWTYDQLLLILPIAALIMAMDRMGVRFPLVATFFLGLDVLVVILLFLDTLLKVEILNVVVPLIIFGSCLWWLIHRLPARDG